MQSKLIELDLRRFGSLQGDMLRRLSEIMVRDIDAFNEMIATLTQGRERDIDWWVSRPATRNNHVSLLHARCAQLALVRELIESDHSVVVRLDCPVMANILRRAQLPNLVIRAEGLLKTLVYRMTQRAADMAASIFHCAAAAIAARITRPTIQRSSPAALTIINTFVSREGLREGRFRDRYFPGLMESLSLDARSRCRYVPVFYRMRDYVRAFQILRRHDITFLFYEDHLNLSDYLFAFGHWRRARKFRNLRAQYAGFEVGPLVVLDANSGRFSSIVVRALLAYRFHLRSKERGLNFRTVLDWYEGLDYNHAVAAAINWHWPQTSLTGFRSAGSLYYMSCTPAPHEVAAGVVPSRMAVVGTGLAKDIKALCPPLRVIDAPGMRYAKLSAIQREPTEGGAVLLALPLSPELALNCIRTLAAAQLRIANRPRYWWVKSHPTLPEDEILALLRSPLPEGFEFVRGDFYAWLSRSDVVAGVASSALIEAVALGIPAICLATGNAPVEFPVPGWVSPRLSRVTYDADETADAIEKMIHEELPRENIQARRAALLGDISSSAMRNLLELP